MQVKLFPKAAPATELKIWIGVFGATSAPSLQWTLNGDEANPEPLSAIKSIRPDEYFSSLHKASKQPRAFSGLYRFIGLVPGGSNHITVKAGNAEAATLTVRTLPSAVPTAPDEWFNVLLASCFYQPTDRTALAASLARLRPADRPHLTLLAGDQVYLDYPMGRVFPPGKKSLARIFEKKYTRNWLGTPGFSELLSMAPTVTLPDDHEYWNNFPARNILIWNTWICATFEKWKKAAGTMWDGFQRILPSERGEPIILDIHPLSFFLADTRTLRDKHRKFTMSQGQRDRLKSWVAASLAQGRSGIFVSGQSLLQKPQPRFFKKSIGTSMSDYGDYPEIMALIRGFVDGGKSILCLTGDVHWSRITEAKNTEGTGNFYEVISSPTSLIAVPFVDCIRMALNAISRWFGKNPSSWPKHFNAKKPPKSLPLGIFKGFSPCTFARHYRGNSICLLSFNNGAAGLRLKVRFFPITSRPDLVEPASSAYEATL